VHAIADRHDPARAAGGLTILRAVSGRIATKRFSAARDGRVRKSGYGKERYFTLEPVEAGNIVELAALLKRLERDPRALLVRGAPLPEANRRHARRLLHHDPRTGDAPTLAAADRCWVMIDLDGVACPAGLDPRLPEDADELIDHLTGLLPVEFHDATCYWQWSASQSVPDRLGSDPPDQLRAHLFFWLDRPVPDGELRRWASGLKKSGLPIDPAVFAPVQPHYTATPVLDGIPDPLSRRSGFRRRLEDAVALVLPPQSSSHVNGDTVRACGGAGLAFHLGRIGPEGYQEPIKATIAAYIAQHGPNADCEPIKAEIRARIDEVRDEHPRSPRDLDRYRSDRFLDDKITWTCAREEAAAAAALPRPRSLPPYFAEEGADRDAVLAEQRSTIRGWLIRNAKIIHARQEIERRRTTALAEAGIFDDPFDFNADESRDIRRRKAAITRRVRRQVLAELALDHLPRQGERTLITGAQGSGKSRTVAETIAQYNGGMTIRWLVPTIEKAQEQAAEYRLAAGRDSPQAWVVRGRGAPNPEALHMAMCPRHKVVNRAAEKEICETCALKAACGYQRQRRTLQAAAEGGGLFITSAEYLWLPCPAPRADIVIVDESVMGRATESTSLDPRRLTEDDKWAGKDIGEAMRRRQVASVVRRAITEHPAAELAFLRDQQITLDDLKAALKHLGTREDSQPKVHGQMTDQAIAKALDASRPARRARCCSSSVSCVGSSSSRVPG
jgi:hypothetical protein